MKTSASLVDKPSLASKAPTVSLDTKWNVTRIMQMTVTHRKRENQCDACDSCVGFDGFVGAEGFDGLDGVDGMDGVDGVDGDGFDGFESFDCWCDSSEMENLEK